MATLIWQVPISLCSEIIDYFEYHLTASVNVRYLSEFDELPPKLYRKLTLELNQNVLQNCRYAVKV